MLVSALIVCSCAQTKSSKISVFEDRRQKVALYRSLGPDGAPVGKGYAHPIEIDVADLKYLLRTINYREKGLFGWSEFRPVFAAEELYRLAPHLIEAFAKASPDDEILFSSKAVKGGSIFSSERFTDGRMFLKDDKLNCLFGNINIKLATTDKYEGDPRKDYAGVFSKLVADSWQTLVEGPKGIHYNWIELDYKVALAKKVESERKARARLKRTRAIKQEKEFKETGWEEWNPGDAVEKEKESNLEDDVVWPSE